MNCKVCGCALNPNAEKDMLLKKCQWCRAEETKKKNEELRMQNEQN